MRRGRTRARTDTVSDPSCTASGPSVVETWIMGRSLGSHFNRLHCVGKGTDWSNGRPSARQGKGKRERGSGTCVRLPGVAVIGARLSQGVCITGAPWIRPAEWVWGEGWDRHGPRRGKDRSTRSSSPPPCMFYGRCKIDVSDIQCRKRRESDRLTYGRGQDRAVDRATLSVWGCIPDRGRDQSDRAINLAHSRSAWESLVRPGDAD